MVVEAAEEEGAVADAAAGAAEVVAEGDHSLNKSPLWTFRITLVLTYLFSQIYPCFTRTQFL